MHPSSATRNVATGDVKSETTHSTLRMTHRTLNMCPSLESQLADDVDSCEFTSMGSCSNMGFSKRNHHWCLLPNNSNEAKSAPNNQTDSAWVCCGSSFDECCDPNPVGIATAVTLFAVLAIGLMLVVRCRRGPKRSCGGCAWRACERPRSLDGTEPSGRVTSTAPVR